MKLQYLFLSFVNYRFMLSFLTTFTISVTVVSICMYGTKAGVWVQNVFTITKFLALLFLVSLAVAYLCQGKYLLFIIKLIPLFREENFSN